MLGAREKSGLSRRVILFAFLYVKVSRTISSGALTNCWAPPASSQLNSAPGVLLLFQFSEPFVHLETLFLSSIPLLCSNLNREFPGHCTKPLPLDKCGHPEVRFPLPLQRLSVLLWLMAVVVPHGSYCMFCIFRCTSHFQKDTCST